MNDTAAAHTVTLQRVLRAPPERVYLAFLDPAAMMKWLPPHGFSGTVHTMEARVGGRYRMSFTQLASGQQHAWSGQFTALQPGRLIVHEDVFDDPALAGTLRTTVRLQPVFCGTALTVEQAGIPAAIPPEACHLGWQDSLQLLTLLVEAQG